MPARHTRPAGPARTAAFVLVALAALGLVFLHFASHEDRVSVPAGAHAGQLTLRPCDYDTERGSYAADCGTLVVSENRHDPRARLIALPVTRIRARTEHPGAPILRLEVGPGRTNMEFANASRFADRHDVLRRLRSDGVDLAGYSLAQRVDDLEAARRALGYRRVNLLSESAGTRTAMIYSWRYPKSVHRSVMIGVNPPGHFVWDSRTIDGQIRQYSALCAKDDDCRARTVPTSTYPGIHARRNGQDHARCDRRLRSPRGPLAAVAGAPGEQAGRRRAQGQRAAALAVPGGARSRWMVPRHSVRADDRPRPSRSTTSCSRRSRSAPRSASGSTGPGSVAP